MLVIIISAVSTMMDKVMNFAGYLNLRTQGCRLFESLVRPAY